MTKHSNVFTRALAIGLAGLAAFCPGSSQSADREEEIDRARRQNMVATQIEGRGVTNAVVLAALREVPRHRFVSESQRQAAYDDGPLPIGHGQTISQPYVVAIMTAAIQPKKGMKVLEVGTGSGYQAAVLSLCVGEVDSIEVIPELGRRAEALLKKLNYRNVHVHIGDGFDGLPERAPFDAIVLTAAPEQVPKPLLDQLREGGRLVAPVGRDLQKLLVISKTRQGLETKVIDFVKFVPMTGKAASKRRATAAPGPRPKAQPSASPTK
jgi:protein-L-isoaspartate(D-aspartate) O-methyltransferase